MIQMTQYLTRVLIKVQMATTIIIMVELLQEEVTIIIECE